MGILSNWRQTMEILAKKMKYAGGDLRESGRSSWNDIQMCVSTTRRFFDLPSKKEMRQAQEKLPDKAPQYVVSVHDKKKKHGVAIRIKPSTIDKVNNGWWGSDDRKVQVDVTDNEGHIRWSSVSFYHDTLCAMLELFDKSKKKTLYVVIEAV